MKRERGQIIVIAAIIISIMVISLSNILYAFSMLHRPRMWEDYTGVVGNVIIGTRRVMAVSLANYTYCYDQGLDPSVIREELKGNIDGWRGALEENKHVLPGQGLRFNYSLSEGTQTASGVSVTYDLGLNASWGNPVSISTANSTYELDLLKPGIKGYKFFLVTLVKMNITSAEYDAQSDDLKIELTLTNEAEKVISGLKRENFTSVKYYDGTWVDVTDFSLTEYSTKYVIKFSVTQQPQEISVTAIDPRFIIVRGNSTDIVQV